ncbi:MAG: hypothetical protein HXS50_00605, partial [Theionarchaea archaeon]|nr:hypothetical protein [Theionarchaea archaeon]
GSEDLTDDAITYVFSRLGWNPRCSVEELTVNWASKAFGRGAAGDIARIFLLGSVAVRDGLYLRQPGLHNWEPIPHLRVNDFVVKGVPDLDNGRTHDEYLKSIYLQCKPWLEQTESELDHGEAVCREMIGIFEGCRDRIVDGSKAKDLEKILQHGLATMRLNGGYARAFLRYFKYREEPTEGNRDVLEERLRDLEEAISDYRARFDFYNMQGIIAFQALAKRAIDDLEGAERTLKSSPTMDDLQAMFDWERENWEKRLEVSSDSILIATWKGSMDGRDIIRIRDGKFTIEHIADDPIVSPQIWAHADFPRGKKCEVVIKPLDVPGNIHIKEQPSPENDYTLTLYTEDRTPGRSVYLFEIHAICE